MSLTGQDKQWLGQQLDHLYQRFEQRFEQVDQRFERVDQKFAQVDQKFEQPDQKLERVETTMLTEFHKWASPTEARLRTHAAALRAIDLEMEALSERVTKLEDRPQ
ncbi:MAG: hypothetical protein ABSH56_04170 [Bryobacteraceae bacterium]|jgi:hypothetical protein